MFLSLVTPVSDVEDIEHKSEEDGARSDLLNLHGLCLLAEALSRLPSGSVSTTISIRSRRRGDESTCKYSRYRARTDDRVQNESSNGEEDEAADEAGHAEQEPLSDELLEFPLLGRRTKKQKHSLSSTYRSMVSFFAALEQLSPQSQVRGEEEEDDRGERHMR